MSWVTLQYLRCALTNFANDVYIIERKYTAGVKLAARRTDFGEAALGPAGYAPRAKVAPFAGGNEGDVRKMAGAPSPQAIFLIN
jgi:hypothetical protein